jgi:hypothetical protein
MGLTTSVGNGKTGWAMAVDNTVPSAMVINTTRDLLKIGLLVMVKRPC